MHVSVLMCCPLDSLAHNESIYIEALDTIHPRGYNLRCGNTAGVPPACGMQLSTFVVDPKDATDEMRKAVEDDLEEITGTRPPTMAWSGPVRVSIADLNRMRGATMDLPWAGPVKGVPVNVKPQSGPLPFPSMFADVAESLARQGRVDHQARMDNLEFQEKQQISNGRMQISNGRKFVEGEKLAREHLIGKIKDAESTGMHDKAAALKRKLSVMLDA